MIHAWKQFINYCFFWKKYKLDERPHLSHLSFICVLTALAFFFIFKKEKQNDKFQSLCLRMHIICSRKKHKRLNVAAHYSFILLNRCFPHFFKSLFSLLFLFFFFFCCRNQISSKIMCANSGSTKSKLILHSIWRKTPTKE